MEFLDMMKRGKEEEEGDDHMDMANCLMLLSRVGESKSDHGQTKLSPTGRLFACKTCNKKFSSFQALGGHRASHKKPKLDVKDWFKLPISAPAKRKAHECSICGLEFSIGQALGGHMRRHRAADANTKSERLVARALLPAVSVMKKSSSKRVFCLDLNLTPIENDLTLQLGKLPPALDCLS